MRLSCPPDSPSCVRQEPIPMGDGCDQLDWWFHKQPDTGIAPNTPKPPKPVMPAECRNVLRD
jgi:penicillin-insensitive murein endopeptidase